MYRQLVPELGLSIEKGTASVPDDDQYHVMFAGEIIYSSRSEKRAVRCYVEKKNELFEARGGKPTPKPLSAEERLAKELAYRDIQSMRIESFDRRASSSRKKGGKGGRGGVS